MIQRHTHIFGADSAADADEVLDLWTRNKMKERGQKTYAEVLREVGHSLPALLRGRKLIDKAARAGVMQADAQAIARDAAERIELAAGSDDAERALGEALLMLCALARVKKVDPEIALNEAADRFVERFAKLEEALGEQGTPLPAPEARAEEYWDRVKL